jgi:hypothetical protein
VAEPVARKPSGRNVLPILKVCRQARGERCQLLPRCAGERTKAAIAERQKFSALLKMLRAGLT